MIERSDKILIQKSIKIGERIVPRKNANVPVAVATMNFKKDDVGICDYSVVYPVFVNNMFLLLPGLKKCNHKESEKIKKGLKKDENKKQKITTRKWAARKKDKGASS